MSAICLSFSLILNLRILLSSLGCLWQAPISLTTFLARVTISGVETDFVKHTLRKSLLLLSFMCLILFFMSVINRFFKIMGFLSLVIRFSNEVTVLGDTESTYLNVTMVFMDSQTNGKTTININKIKYCKHILQIVELSIYIRLSSGLFPSAFHCLMQTTSIPI